MKKLFLLAACLFLFAAGCQGEWTLSLYDGGQTIGRLPYSSKDACLTAGSSYLADKSIERFDCGYKCTNEQDLHVGIACKQVCNTAGCR